MYNHTIIALIFTDLHVWTCNNVDQVFVSANNTTVVCQSQKGPNVYGKGRGGNDLIVKSKQHVSWKKGIMRDAYIYIV